MKKLYLDVVSNDGASWIIFEKEDDLSFTLPSGTIYEAVENYRGKVMNHYYNEKEEKFITNIEVRSVLHFQLEYFKKELLVKGWKIQYQDSDLMIRDKCE